MLPLFKASDYYLCGINTYCQENPTELQPHLVPLVDLVGSLG